MMPQRSDAHYELTLSCRAIWIWCENLLMQSSQKRRHAITFRFGSYVMLLTFLMSLLFLLGCPLSLHMHNCLSVFVVQKGFLLFLTFIVYTDTFGKPNYEISSYH